MYPHIFNIYQLQKEGGDMVKPTRGQKRRGKVAQTVGNAINASGRVLYSTSVPIP